MLQPVITTENELRSLVRRHRDIGSDLDSLYKKITLDFVVDLDMLKLIVTKEGLTGK